METTTPSPEEPIVGSAKPMKSGGSLYILIPHDVVKKFGIKDDDSTVFVIRTRQGDGKDKIIYEKEQTTIPNGTPAEPIPEE